MKYIKNAKIETSQCDSRAYLSLIGAASIIQDAVCNGLGIIGCDNVTLKNEYQAFWVFVKNKIIKLNELAWNDDYRVESFMSEANKAKALMDTIIYNKNNEICYYSKIEICAIDYPTHKFRRLNTVGVNLEAQLDKMEMEYGFDDFDCESLDYLKNITVEATNIDFSHHTNNLEYVRFITNTYTVEELESLSYKEFSIYYVKETKENDNLSIFKSSNANKDYIVIKNGDIIVNKAILVK